MSLLSIVFGQPIVQIGVDPTHNEAAGPDRNAVTIDAMIRENESRSATVVQHPIESGALVSDHVTLGPRQLSLEGVISPTPNTQIEALQRSSTAHVEAWNKLNDLMDARDVFDIVTGFRRIRSLVFKSLSRVRDSQSTNVLRFTAQLEQITFVDSEIVTLKPIDSAKSKGSGKKDRGDQGPTDADASVASDAKSTLSSVGDFVGGLF